MCASVVGCACVRYKSTCTAGVLKFLPRPQRKTAARPSDSSKRANAWSMVTGPVARRRSLRRRVFSFRTEATPLTLVIAQASAELQVCNEPGSHALVVGGHEDLGWHPPRPARYRWHTVGAHPRAPAPSWRSLPLAEHGIECGARTLQVGDRRELSHPIDELLGAKRFSEHAKHSSVVVRNALQ
jgi:hypothetical protein